MKHACKDHKIHEDIINKVKNLIPKDELLYELADFFKMFGDTTRIKILHALFVSEMCVCDIAELLLVSQSAVSHQLKTLKQSNIVKYRREGKAIYYSLKDEHVKKIIDMGIKHAKEF